jgi:hypothetical protein
VRTDLRRAIVGAVVLLVGICGGDGRAAASAFDPAQVIEVLKREFGAADAVGDAGSRRLKLEEAVLDLDLVEVPGKAGSRLMVPGADFGTERHEVPKAGLRRRLVVDLAGQREAKPGASPDPAAMTADPGPLASVLADFRSSLRSAVDAPPAWDLKRLTIELEFVLERDGKQGLRPVIFAVGRPVDAKNVQKLKLRFSAPSD